MNLAPVLRQRFLDANGNPLSGGKLYSYQSGTTTPQATYTDSAGGTPNANPVILDANGEASVWLNQSYSYKFVLKDSSDVTQWTTDGVVGALTADAVATASIQDSAVTTAKIADDAVTAAKLRDDASVDANRAVTTNHIRDGAITRDKLATGPDPFTNGFRLTLTSGTPVTTSDVTGATTIYCAPFKGNQIALYDGSSKWNIRTSSEFSLALGTLTSGRPYDVFCYDNAGTPTLEFLVWTNDTTRATALVLQDGVYVKSGATTRRYLGTFYTDSTTTTKDTAQYRYLYNYCNQVKRHLLRRESTVSWNYNSATVRQANNSTANQVEVMNGLDINAVELNVLAQYGGTGSGDFTTNIGLDSTTTPATTLSGGGNVNNSTRYGTAFFNGYVGVGRHYLAWLESAVNGGTSVQYGAYNGLAGATNTLYSGLMGIWYA